MYYFSCEEFPKKDLCVEVFAYLVEIYGHIEDCVGAKMLRSYARLSKKRKGNTLTQMSNKNQTCKILRSFEKQNL